MQLALPDRSKRGAVRSQISFLPLLPTFQWNKNVWQWQIHPINPLILDFRDLKSAFVKKKKTLLCHSMSAVHKAKVLNRLHNHLAAQSLLASFSRLCLPSYLLPCFVNLATNCHSLSLTPSIYQHVKNLLVFPSACLAICKALKLGLILNSWMMPLQAARLDAGYSTSGPHCSPVPLEDKQQLTFVLWRAWCLQQFCFLVVLDGHFPWFNFMHSDRIIVRHSEVYILTGINQMSSEYIMK